MNNKDNPKARVRSLESAMLSEEAHPDAVDDAIDVACHVIGINERLFRNVKFYNSVPEVIDCNINYNGLKFSLTFCPEDKVMLKLHSSDATMSTWDKNYILTFIDCLRR